MLPVKEIFEKLSDKEPMLIMSTSSAYQQDNVDMLQNCISDIEKEVHLLVKSYNLTDRQEEYLVNQLLRTIASAKVTINKGE